MSQQRPDPAGQLQPETPQMHIQGLQIAHLFIQQFDLLALLRLLLYGLRQRFGFAGHTRHGFATTAQFLLTLIQGLRLTVHLRFGKLKIRFIKIQCRLRLPRLVKIFADLHPGFLRRAEIGFQFGTAAHPFFELSLLLQPRLRCRNPFCAGRMGVRIVINGAQLGQLRLILLVPLLQGFTLSRQLGKLFFCLIQPCLPFHQLFLLPA